LRGREPWLLAFDLSGPRGLVVLEGKGELFSRALENAAGAAAIISLAGEILAEAGISPRDLGVVGAARGPGAFTGVRTAVMAAKALGEVLRTPLVAPESLAVVAACQAEGYVFVAADARRGQVYYGLYEVEEVAAGCFPLALEGPAVASPQEAAACLGGWLDKLGGEIALADTGARAYPDLWPAGLRRPAGGIPDPRSLAGLCRELHRRGETVDPLRLEPLYLRNPDVGRRKGRGAG